MLAERFNPDHLIAQACERAGSDDFRGFVDFQHTWRDGPQRLCDGLIHDARLSPLGVEIAIAESCVP